jgi:hypothetical protein
MSGVPLFCVFDPFAESRLPVSRGPALVGSVIAEGQHLPLEATRRPAIDYPLRSRRQDRLPIIGKGGERSAFARLGRTRSFSFLYGSMVQWFFYVPLLSRCCLGCCPAAVSGCYFQVLIFVVIADGYDKPPLSRFRLDHCLGFQSGNEPLNGAFRHAPRLGELTH